MRSELAEFVTGKINEYYQKTGNLKALAIDAGVSPICLYKWTYGTQQPSLRSVERIIDALGYEIVIRRKHGI